MTPAEGRLAMQAMLRGKPESYEEARAAFKLRLLTRGWWDLVEDDDYRCGLRYKNQGGAICQPKGAPAMQPDGPECPTCGGWHVVPCYNIFCDPPEPHECLDCDFEQDWPSIHSAPIDFCEPGALTAEHECSYRIELAEALAEEAVDYLLYDGKGYLRASLDAFNASAGEVPDA